VRACVRANIYFILVSTSSFSDHGKKIPRILKVTTLEASSGVEKFSAQNF